MQSFVINYMLRHDGFEK